MSSVSASAPRIGFDRFIALDWVSTAMRVRADAATKSELLGRLDEAELTLAARKKTLTLLNRLWLEPRAELVPFCDRGVAAWRSGKGVPPAAFAWGITIAVYPFFAKVAELVGRLTALQGDCRATEIHRRMEEMFGQREGTRRMTNMALQTQEDWGAIERSARGQHIVRKDALRLDDVTTMGWLIEAALRYTGRSLPSSSFATLPVLYPFLFEQPLAMVVSEAEGLELRYHGPGEQVIDIKGRS